MNTNAEPTPVYEPMLDDQSLSLARTIFAGLVTPYLASAPSTSALEEVLQSHADRESSHVEFKSGDTCNRVVALAMASIAAAQEFNNVNGYYFTRIPQ